MTALCETFRRQAFWTWDQLGRARRINAHLGEESLTDFNLLEIRSRHSQEVITKTFTKAEEGVIGADWEWWLTGRSLQWVGFRLQAKVINHVSERFEHLHYTTQAGRHQSEMLCERSRTNGCIPLYCLYTHWSPASLRTPWRCGSYAATPESYGCSLVDGFYVDRVRADPNSRRLDSLIEHMTPWHCLVCCAAAGGEDLASRALNFWRAGIFDADAPGVSGISFAPLPEPPFYIRQLLQNELVEPPDPFVRTVTVLREGGS